MNNCQSPQQAACGNMLLEVFENKEVLRFYFSDVGESGLSAYELAVANGFSGTLDEWLESLKGEPGEQGKDGLSAYELAVIDGFEGTPQEWLASLVGADGRDGLSAYEVAVDSGFIGTEQEWLASLEGEQGKDGLTAYEVAVREGFVGTEQQWLESLKGPKGDQGPGYQFIGDYAAGVELTEYNQLVRDENGEFWRVSGQIDLPYTTTGNGVPESDALVSAGDAVLRQDLANPDMGAAMVARGVVAVDSIADLLALPEGQRKEGLRYLVKGYHAGSGIGGGEFYWDVSRVSVNDGGSVINGFTRIFDGVVTPEMFGAVGDGVELDSESILNAIAAAGEGGVIHLSPEKVYLVDRRINMLDYQTIVGNNATLRRVDQVVTTTTTPMSSASTTVSLASAAGFKVGQRVSFAQVGVARGSLTINSTLSQQCIITNISGNTITLNGGVGISLDSGSTCFLAFNTLMMRGMCRVSGVIFDGNRSNWSFNRWEVICEIDTDNSAFGQLVTNNLFVDSPSEAIIARSNDAVYSHNRFKDINGNAFHTSAAKNNLIIGNHGVNGNLDMDVGHQDGFVSISLQNFNITIKDNIASQFVSGVSPITEATGRNANFIISDNQFKDMYCWGIGLVSAPNVTITGNILDNIPLDPSKKPGYTAYAPIILYGAGRQNTTVSGNIVTNTLDSRSMIINATGTAPGQPSSLKVFGNTLDGGVVAGGQDAQIQLNSIGGSLNLRDCIRFTVKDNAISHITTSGNGEYVDVAIEGNLITGEANNGISFANSPSLYENITCKNNVITGKINRGIQTPGAGAAVIKGFWITGNSIVAGGNALSSFIGIQAARDGFTISDNKISALQTISSGVAIGLGSSQTNFTSLTVTGNEVRGGWKYTIDVASSATGIIVAHNVLEGKDVTGPVGNAETYNVVF